MEVSKDVQASGPNGDITVIDNKEVTEEVVEMHVESVVEVAGGKIAETSFIGSKEVEMVVMEESFEKMTLFLWIQV